jgi:DNA-binding NtrC family response regulator
MRGFFVKLLYKHRGRGSTLPCVATEKFPRRLIRQVEGRDSFPLVALSAVQDVRAHLDEVEAEAILQARELGASAEDIAQALGITRQGAYYKMKQLERAEPADDGDDQDVTVTLPEAETPHREPA